MLKTIRKLRKYFQVEIVGEKSAGQNGRKEFLFFFSFFFYLSYFIWGYISDFSPIIGAQGKFSSNNQYALVMIFWELSRFLVLCEKLCFRIQGDWKVSSLWDRIYELSRDRIHFPIFSSMFWNQTRIAVRFFFSFLNTNVSW